MPSLKAIRRRISSVQSTQKITRAMKLIAAVRLRRAQDRLFAMRPYRFLLAEMIAELAAHTEHTDHPLLAVRDPKRIGLLTITSDRGLCGAFNTNISRKTDRFAAENRAHERTLALSVVGRKGRDYFQRRKYDVQHY